MPGRIWRCIIFHHFYLYFSFQLMRPIITIFTAQSCLTYGFTSLSQFLLLLSILAYTILFVFIFLLSLLFKLHWCHSSCCWHNPPLLRMIIYDNSSEFFWRHQKFKKWIFFIFCNAMYFCKYFVRTFYYNGLQRTV